MSTTMATQKIMVVEDNAAVAEDCRDCLENLGYEVTSVLASGEESIDRAEVERPDAILMDIHLRDQMDGIEASEQIYKQFKIPVVFLSAYSDRTLLQRAKHSGSFGYLVKPFNERELYATLEMAIYKSQHEAERKSLIDQLEVKNAEMERYTYTVSHDLKSPLVTINGFVNMLEKDAYDRNVEQMQIDLQHIHSAVKKMSNLLNDLLELSKIGRVANLFVDLSLLDLTNEVVELLAFPLKEKKVQLNISPDLPVITGDRRRLGEVIQNLIENAIKYMGDQSAPKIDIGTRQDNGRAVVYVKDNGIGINPKYCEKIFDLFDQLDPSKGGTGIGLAIVKRIIDVHGGEIWAVSKGENQGTTFCFTIVAAN
ncbi:MAG: hybrid sensor histidine kinase/response regulator [Desulfobulbaceae bacterium]|nr:hybrid sensor histidine kinase/response regulator [Desulfobulbaceae bacterium]